MKVNERLVKDLRLPPIGFGMWDYGGELDPDCSRDASRIALLQHAIALGYHHFDTAEMYGGGHSEELLGLALREHERSDFIVTTKVNKQNLGYNDLVAACDRSLDHLQMSYIDIYLIHWPNPLIPLSETFRALNHLKQAGKIRHIGVSNFDVSLLEQAVKLSDTPLATNQVRYSLFYRRPQDNGTLTFCRQNDIVLTAYSPLRLGDLSHPVVIEIANRRAATPAQVQQIRQQQNLEAANIQLSEADIQNLNALRTT
jgi:diketogulonate reductase-like aldo/keto reductase